MAVDDGMGVRRRFGPEVVFHDDGIYRFAANIYHQFVILYHIAFEESQAYRAKLMIFVQPGEKTFIIKFPVRDHCSAAYISDRFSVFKDLGPGSGNPSSGHGHTFEHARQVGNGGVIAGDNFGVGAKLLL